MITQFTDDQNFTDEQKQYMLDLVKHDVGGWHAMHGRNQDFRCAYCGRDFCASFDNFHSLTFDHIKPESHGGAHTFENTLACCWPCNHLKGAYVPKGETRAARIDDARDYVKARRSTREAAVAKLRLYVCGVLEKDG
jgi:5-methylcytosine-specific restriction endonuclease McrA